ncbi:MAG: hypothetical protein ACN2B6_01275 [Rickettsiales bacterium]
MNENQVRVRRLVRDGFCGIVRWRDFDIVFLAFVRMDMKDVRANCTDIYFVLSEFSSKHSIPMKDIIIASSKNKEEVSGDIMKLMGLRYGVSEGAVL